MNGEALKAIIAERIERDPRLRKIRAKTAKGKATKADSFTYSRICSEIMSEELAKAVLDLDDREGICAALLRGNYEEIMQTADAIQRSIDEKQGIHMQPRRPAFPAERVQQIAHSLVQPDVPDEKIVRRAGSTATVSMSFHDDFVQENARFRARAGLKCYITRETDGSCCKWCSALAGRYEYGEEPQDVYRRHDNCGCTVTFENGRQRQDVWSKRTWEVPGKDAGAKEPARLTTEQAAAKEAEHLPKRLTRGAESGTMDSADSRDDKAARRRFDSLTPEQRAEVVMRGIQAPDATFSYDRPDNNAMTLLRRVPSTPFTFDVRAHGLDTMIEFFRQDFPDGDPRAFIDAYTLATILRGRSDFQAFLAACAEAGEKPKIRLLACSTGDTTNTGNCFAQLLANELGIVVYAPTMTLYAENNGSFYIGKRKQGKLKDFIPRK